MLPVGTERTNVAWRVMDQAVAYHFILSLKPFAAFTSRAIFHGTVMWSVLRVDLRMRAGPVLAYKPLGSIIILT